MANMNTILMGIIVGLVLYKFMLNGSVEKMSMLISEKLNVLDKKKCSRDCCKHSQWPVPHMKKINNDNIGTNMMCNHGEGGGCVCMTEGDLNYLGVRGQNK